MEFPTDNLREVFEAFGAVSSAKVITDKYSGRSKGFGFVEMDNDAEANAAIEQLDGAEIDGRSVKVNEARQKKITAVAVVDIEVVETEAVAVAIADRIF